MFNRYATASAALIGCLLRAPGALVAQVEPARGDTTTAATLEPITVIGARDPSVAPPVETIEVPAERLHRSPAAGPYDLVRRTAGIEVHEQGQGPGFASDAVIRGFTSDHSSDVLLVVGDLHVANFGVWCDHSSDVLLTVDGVPINLPLHGHVEGYADWSLLTPASLASLRVIHGPSSPLYGDFAFGGVVEATTADDAQGSMGSLRASSFGDVGGWMRRHPAGCSQSTDSGSRAGATTRTTGSATRLRTVGGGSVPAGST